MEQGSTTGDAGGTGLFAGDAWFDPIEAGIRDRVRGFIQELLEQELTAALRRSKSERVTGEPKGYRNGTRERQLLGSFGPVEVEVLRARMAAAGGTSEWRSTALPRYARMTRQVEALVAGAYLSGTNTRRVKRALAALFGGRSARTWSAALGARSAWTGTPEKFCCKSWIGLCWLVTNRRLRRPCRTGRQQGRPVLARHAFRRV